MSSRVPLSLQSTVKLRSGYDMPLVGLGVYQNRDCVPACVTAWKHGYRHVDTAQAYRNEDQVGRALRESDVPREDIFLTTKVVQGSHGFEVTQQVVEESLMKLGTSYVDLFLLHSPLAGKNKRLQAYRALLRKRDEGKIHSVGVSNYGVHHLEEICQDGLETPTVNQIELHPFCQQKEIVDYCAKNGIVVQAYCPLIRGDFRHPVLQDISNQTGKNPAQVLIRWSLQRGFAPVHKSSKEERVVSNVDIYDFTLNDTQMSQLNALDRGAAGAIGWNPVDAA